jgi:ABC-type antimicrobial peptide transport system permease subunit
MDAELTTPRFTAMEQVISTAGAPRRFNFVVLATFALLAGALAAVGLYGVLSYLVADRQREIGIRLALGAEPQRLVQLVVVEGMRLAFVGLFLGLGGSLVAVRLLRHMLFGVSVYDPLAFVAGAVLLTLVALVACWVPAHRAARIEPMVVLRE